MENTKRQNVLSGYVYREIKGYAESFRDRVATHLIAIASESGKAIEQSDINQAICAAHSEYTRENSIVFSDDSIARAGGDIAHGRVHDLKDLVNVVFG